MALRRILALNRTAAEADDHESLQEGRAATTNAAILAERGARVGTVLRTEVSAGAGLCGHASLGTTVNTLIFADGADADCATAADEGLSCGSADQTGSHFEFEAPQRCE
jgi:hypothetical protein